MRITILIWTLGVWVRRACVIPLKSYLSLGTEFCQLSAPPGNSFSTSVSQHQHMFTKLPLIIQAFEPRHCTNMTYHLPFSANQIGDRIQQYDEFRHFLVKAYARIHHRRLERLNFPLLRHLS